MKFISECNCQYKDSCELTERIEDAIRELEEDYLSIGDFDDVIVIDSTDFFWDGTISETEYSFQISCGVLQRASENHLKEILRRLYYDTELNVRDDISEDDDEELLDEESLGEEEFTGDELDFKDEDEGDNLARAISRLETASKIGYSIEIIHDGDINAHALPEGKIQITSAAVNQLSESELAFLIAHEEAHLDEKHGKLKSSLATGVDTIMKKIITDKESGVLERLADVAIVSATTVVAAPLVSKACEIRADVAAQKRMLEAGYQEEETTKFFDRIGPREGRYFSTHPTPQTRKKWLKK